MAEHKRKMGYHTNRQDFNQSFYEIAKCEPVGDLKHWEPQTRGDRRGPWGKGVCIHQEDLPCGLTLDGPEKDGGQSGDQRNCPGDVGVEEGKTTASGKMLSMLLCVCACVCSVTSDLLQPHGL